MDTSLKHKYFFNRELSWLEFNHRVLEEAKDNGNPLFERLKFLSIVCSNLDEFFMVRVGSLQDQVLAEFKKLDPAGLTPEEQMVKISIRTHQMIYDEYNCFNRSLKQAMKKQGVVFLKPKQLTKEQTAFVNDYYSKNVYPVLTPMVVDQSRPFPLLLNKSLNIALLIETKKGDKGNMFASVQVPSVLNRFVELPGSEGLRNFILLEDMITMNLNGLFTGHNIITSSFFRITRNADLSIDEEEAEDLLEAIEESVKQRRWGAVVRLEVDKDMDKTLVNILLEELEVSLGELYEIEGPLDLTYLMKLTSLSGYENLKYSPLEPQPSPYFMENENIFDVISKNDVIIHHPYQAFDPIIQMVKTAAEDPDVLAIKQTLYRVSGNSPIVAALAKAAENGKQVTVLVELKARFDEENNIIWAKRLEKAGCHVIYGLIGLKTHCKVLLVVRKEENGIKRYVHLGTGNYNDVTARIYSDFGLFTTNPYFGADASALFNMLSGHSEPHNMYKVVLAPLNMRESFITLIRQEADNAKAGRKARIFAKVNSLVDTEIIEELYKASTAGVDIELLVRGICCLKPGVPGISERITVKSIVGRFLEHSRIYYFYNNGEELTYLSSADLMTRNLDRRVELLFPVEDANVKKKIKELIEISLRDTVKARILKPDGTYVRVDKRKKAIINSQEVFCKLALKEVKKLKKESTVIDFKPIVS